MANSVLAIIIDDTCFIATTFGSVEFVMSPTPSMNSNEKVSVDCKFDLSFLYQI